MKNRIQRAIEAIRAANRYYLLGEVALIPDETGNLTQACVLDDVAAILRGNSPESPDNSPVTADDLAVADYYEAVRQRVPWMTSIEHIEDLIEGHRQCGVMVWKAAEQVKLILGVDNDGTD